jgi:hypothetical protein
MAATTGAAGSNEPDMGLIGELLEDITRNPSAIGARKLLVEHYISVAWLDAALDNAKELKALAPRDPDIESYLQVLQKKPAPPAPEKPKVASVSLSRERHTITSCYKDYKKTGISKHVTQRSVAATVKLTGDLEFTRDLKQGYPALRAMAKHMITDFRYLQTLYKKAGLPHSKNFAKIEAIAQGGKGEPSDTTGSPDSARSVARTIQENSKEALERAIANLENMINWLRPAPRPC